MARATKEAAATTSQEDALKPEPEWEDVPMSLDDGQEPPESAPPAKGEFSELDPKQLRARLYSRAQTVIIERHRAEFNEVADGLFKEHGLSFGRKRTAKEKAADTIAELLKKHPELRPEFPGVGFEADNESSVGENIA